MKCPYVNGTVNCDRRDADDPTPHTLAIPVPFSGGTAIPRRKRND